MPTLKIDVMALASKYLENGQTIPKGLFSPSVSAMLKSEIKKAYVAACHEMILQLENKAKEFQEGKLSHE